MKTEIFIFLVFIIFSLYRNFKKEKGEMYTFFIREYKFRYEMPKPCSCSLFVGFLLGCETVNTV